MPLTDLAIRNAAPRDREFKLSDAGGLYLLVKPNGSRLWNLAFRFDGRQKKLSLGMYPTIDLKEARVRRETAKRQLASGVDPAFQKRVDKQTRVAAAAATLQVVSDAFMEKQRLEGKAEVTLIRDALTLKPALQDLGSRGIAGITAPEILAVLRKVVARGRLNTARRLRALLSRIFRFGIAEGHCTRDPAADLIDALPAAPKTHRPAFFEPKRIGVLVRDIDELEGYQLVRLALKLQLLTFVRPTELRKAPWTEVNLEKAVWRIAGDRMKMKRDHIVPLSRQAVEAFTEALEMTGGEGLVFPSVRTSRRSLSENTLNAALRRLGYEKQDLVAHGFRRIASTLLNEQGWNKDWVERQLAHVDGNGVRGTYNAAEWLPDRTRMMQHWADWLDRVARDDEDLIG